MSNTLTKTEIEAGRDDPFTLRIDGAFIRKTNLSRADLTGANLAGADARYALFIDANMSGAILTGTDLRGADLTGAKHLLIDQLKVAIIDKTTILPDYIDRDALQSGK